VQVIANICRPEKLESTPSNCFNFVFILGEKATVKKILPSNHDQVCVWFALVRLLPDN